MQGQLTTHRLTVLILALMALGVKSVSMVPAAIGPVKTMLRSADLKAAHEAIRPLLSSPDHSVRAEIETFARQSGIQLHG